MNKSPYCRYLWYIRNILQWNKNNIKSMRMTNRDYSQHTLYAHDDKHEKITIFKMHFSLCTQEDHFRMGIRDIYSQMLRCSKARGSSTGLSLQGPTKVKARKSLFFTEGSLRVIFYF